MIFCNFWIDETQTWGANIVIDALKNNLVLNERFTDELSEASFTVYDIDMSSYTLPIEAWTKCKITLDNGEIKKYVLSQYDSNIVTFGQDAVGHTITGNIHQVDIKLIAQTAITQQLYPDSLCFSNGLEDGIVITRTIRDMLSRIRNQLWTIPEADKGANYQNLPFDFIWDNSEVWLDNVAPEMFFTNKSLFEILVDIGKVIGGFPFMDYDDVLGKYMLTYRMWQDLSTTHWTDDTLVNVAKHSTILNQANVLVGNLENLQNMSLSGENTLVEPCNGEFMPVTTEEYVTEITEDNCVIRTKKPIAKILKVEFGIWENPVEAPAIRQFYSVISDTYYSYPNRTIPLDCFIVEYDVWKTYRQETVFDPAFYNFYVPGIQDTTLYYKRNENIIYNIGGWHSVGIRSAYDKIKYFISQANTSIADTPNTSLILLSKITYIPYETAKVKMWKTNATKPIMEVYNQSANVVSSSAIGNNMFGLVNRLEGKYSIYQKRVMRGDSLYSVGEWLNGEIIVEATHEIGNTEINSLYQTSPFNRRSEFMAVQNNIRLWEIPEDKISDRDLHYAENIEVSIATSIDTTDRESGSLTALGNSLVRDFNTAENTPDLAFLAWKDTTEIASDVDINSNNYGLATVASLPLSKSALITWATSDNASVGGRSLHKSTLAQDGANLQYYINYPEKTDYLNLKLANLAPNTYIFSDIYTETGWEGSINQYFEHTFPMSNKKQWSDCAVGNGLIADFGQWLIQKDLRERIKFNFQLDFIGKNGTLVYDRAISLNRICTNQATTTLKVFVNSATAYSTYDVKAHSDGTEILVASFAEFTSGLQLTATIPAYTNLAITDSENNILFATNEAGEATSALNVYMLNLKKEWQKI